MSRMPPNHDRYEYLEDEYLDEDDDAYEDDDIDSPRFQFGLRSIFLITLLIAVTAALGQGLLRYQKSAAGSFYVLLLVIAPVGAIVVYAAVEALYRRWQNHLDSKEPETEFRLDPRPPTLQKKEGNSRHSGEPKHSDPVRRD